MSASSATSRWLPSGFYSKKSRGLRAKANGDAAHDARILVYTRSGVSMDSGILLLKPGVGSWAQAVGVMRFLGNKRVVECSP